MVLLTHTVCVLLHAKIVLPRFLVQSALYVVAKAVARIVVKDWEGVGDENGAPMAISDDGIDALLELWPIFEAFQTTYIAGALILDAEKNA